jgi:hypothetical protein
MFSSLYKQTHRVGMGDRAGSVDLEIRQDIHQQPKQLQRAGY